MKVAPLAGAWIEITLLSQAVPPIPVAPLAGAWIEILFSKGGLKRVLSLPSRERGLKCVMEVGKKGAWHRRSPRGSVD